jgi:hypothetical protein
MKILNTACTADVFKQYAVPCPLILPAEKTTFSFPSHAHTFHQLLGLHSWVSNCVWFLCNGTQSFQLLACWTIFTYQYLEVVREALRLFTEVKLCFWLESVIISWWLLEHCAHGVGVVWFEVCPWHDRPALYSYFCLSAVASAGITGKQAMTASFHGLSVSLLLSCYLLLYSDSVINKI